MANTSQGFCFWIKTAIIWFNSRTKKLNTKTTVSFSVILHKDFILAYYYASPADILNSMKEVLKYFEVDIPELKKPEGLKPKKPPRKDSEGPVRVLEVP
jgi:hypothetical protein